MDCLSEAAGMHRMPWEQEVRGVLMRSMQRNKERENYLQMDIKYGVLEIQIVKKIIQKQQMSTMLLGYLLMPSMPPSPEPGPANSKKANHNYDEKGIGHLIHYVSPLSTMSTGVTIMRIQY